MGFFDDIADVYSDIWDPVLQPLGISESEASKSHRRAARSFQDLTAPTLSPLEQQDYTSAGDYRQYVTPQSATALSSVDPSTRAAQSAALAKLGEYANTQGLTPQELAQLEEVRRRESIQQQGERGAILSNAQQRGLGSSGLTLDALLRSQQGAADRRNLADIEIASQARQRALDALLKQGALAGDIRGQDYQAASAQDVINQFNSGLMTNAGMAQLQNLQNLSNVNTAQRNTTNQYNTQQLPLTNYGLQREHLGDVTGQQIAAGEARTSQLNGAFDTIANIGAAAAMGPSSPSTSGLMRPNAAPVPTYTAPPRVFSLGRHEIDPNDF